jgi:endonuclease/exonuclease/phosphatase family metal-dependent hydrolase
VKYVLSLFFFVTIFVEGYSSGEAILANADTLKIVSWNIYMRPRHIFKNWQEPRAKAIVEVFSDDVDADIIVFQEAFDKLAKRIIRKGLQSKYPYEYGPGKRGIIRQNSGVWILSKYPIVNKFMAEYKACKYEDCLAKKSALFAEIEKNGKRRADQFKAIADLRDAFYKQGVPQIITGDLNTATINKKAYPNMLEILDAEDGIPESEVKVTSNDMDNDIYKKTGYENQGKTKLIDFILLRKNETTAEISERKVMRFRKRLKNGKYDLSDHYAVYALLLF